FRWSAKGSPMLSADIVRPESARYTTSLLCIPGLWAGPDVWRAFAGYLAHRGWESHLLDVRALDAGVAERAAAVAAHAAALPTPPVLLGHDLGSLVALAAAARTRTAAVVLLAPLVPGSAPARALALRPGTFLQLLPAPAAAAFARALGAEHQSLDGAGHWLFAGPAWQRGVGLVHRWIIQRLGEPLLERYAEAMTEREEDR